MEMSPFPNNKAILEKCQIQDRVRSCRYLYNVTHFHELH